MAAFNKNVGLYPASCPKTMEDKVEFLMNRVRQKASNLEKYILLHTIQDADEELYFAAIMKYPKEIFPLIYTPTVGEACQRWGDIYRSTPRGLYLSLKDKGNIRSILEAQKDKYKDIECIVVTDGERILGLGDLGVNGMGIPIGKLAIYTACGGIPPTKCLPVHLDVGTNSELNLNNEFYLGLQHERIRGQEYDDFVDEFMQAIKDAYGNLLLQFEDFGNLNAFRLLETYRDNMMTFNDDIQGTACVVLSGLMSSKRITGRSLSENTYLFLGAGEAGVGIAELIVRAMMKEKPDVSEATLRQRVWLIDSKGLITKDRVDAGEKMAHHKLPFAHPASLLKSAEGADGMLASVNRVRPTALLGVSAQGGAFTKEVCERMMTISKEDNKKNPIIFALSNPTHKAEVTAKNAYTWTNGECVYASGSPFDTVTLGDKTFSPGQGNNAYIFPGIGLGCIATGAKKIIEDDFIVAAETLANLVSQSQIDVGCCYPPLDDIRPVSASIASAVAKFVIDTGRATKNLPNDIKSLDAVMKERMWTPYV